MIRQEFRNLALCFEKMDVHLKAIKSIFDKIVELMESTHDDSKATAQSASSRVFSEPMICQGKSLEIELESKTNLQKDFEVIVCPEIVDYLRKSFPKVDRINLSTVSRFFDNTMYRLKTKSPFMQTCILCRSVGSGFPCLMVIDVSLPNIRYSTF